jgi:hypothetical protein
MAAVLALNLVLAVVVVAALLRLLSWAIISSRTELQVKAVPRRSARHPYARPHVSHPHWPDGHRAQRGVGSPVTD